MLTLLEASINAYRLLYLSFLGSLIRKNDGSIACPTFDGYSYLVDRVEHSNIRLNITSFVITF